MRKYLGVRVCGAREILYLFNWSTMDLVNFRRGYLSNLVVVILISINYVLINSVLSVIHDPVIVISLQCGLRPDYIKNKKKKVKLIMRISLETNWICHPYFFEFKWISFIWFNSIAFHSICIISFLQARDIYDGATLTKVSTEH